MIGFHFSFPVSHLQSSFGELAKILDANIWANESYHLGIEYAYANLANGSALDNEYVARGRIIAQYVFSIVNLISFLGNK
jgi:hypothetical protein